jgi:hypothetical protein
MNVYQYIAETNPNEANSICERNGLTDAMDTQTIAFYLENIVAQNGEESFNEILSLHPDKEVILECFGKPIEPIVEQKITEVEPQKMMNADGSKDPNVSQHTNMYILIGAVVVSLAIISLKK